MIDPGFDSQKGQKYFFKIRGWATGVYINVCRPLLSTCWCSPVGTTRHYLLGGYGFDSLQVYLLRAQRARLHLALGRGGPTVALGKPPELSSFLMGITSIDCAGEYCTGESR